MRVLYGIVDVVGDLVVHFYRSYTAAKANKQLREQQEKQTPHEMDRRAVYLSQIARDAIDCVDDPRVAVASMMCAISNDGTGLKPVQVSGIQDKLAEIFAVGLEEAEDILSLARWTMKSAHSLDDCLNRLGLVIHENCSLDEKYQVLDMLQFAATLDRPMDEFQNHAITRLKYRLGI